MLPNSHPVHVLATEWRGRANDLRRFSADGAAAAFEECAEELEHAWRVRQTEPLTLDEAAAESGYSYSALQQMVADGRLPNIGETGRPRVCRADLPKKPRAEPPKLRCGEPDLAAEVLASTAEG